MSASLAHRLTDCLPRDPASEHTEIVAALRATPASIPPKYFYDGLGSALFGAICELLEYYPTRAERLIFELNRAEIAARVGTGLQLVDLGAGDGRKAQSWFDTLRPSRYVAIDIASVAIRPLLARLHHEHPNLPTLGILADFTAELGFLHELPQIPTVFFYPGSSIGNFSPRRAASFLRMLQHYCGLAGGNSGLLIGVDVKKDAARLETAYDDALGVTAAFNRNILRHLNRLFETDFDPAGFAHVAFYDPVEGRIEMHLEARTEQRVKIDGKYRIFAAGERIHTENSYKYSPMEFQAMLRDAGFADIRFWQDPAGDFAVFHAC